MYEVKVCVSNPPAECSISRPTWMRLLCGLSPGCQWCCVKYVSLLLGKLKTWKMAFFTNPAFPPGAIRELRADLHCGVQNSLRQNRILAATQGNYCKCGGTTCTAVAIIRRQSKINNTGKSKSISLHKLEHKSRTKNAKTS